MDLASKCPTAAQWNMLLNEACSGHDKSALEAHLGSCPMCRQQMERIVADPDMWNNAVAGLKPRSLEPACALYLERIMSDAKQYDCHSTIGNPASSEDELSLTFLTPSDNPDRLGTLGAYEITDVVGRGGMGVVLKGHDPRLNRVVAIKVLAPELASNATARKRFRREGQAAAAVSHDHVLTIHAVDESNEVPHLVMEYVDGKSLQQRIDCTGTLELTEILRIAMQTAAGLAAAHAQGLVHRDIKPSNILLENGVERVKIGDIGLARAVDDVRVTQPGVVAGTPEYMSPEQGRGETIDHRSDLFSLGSVIYAMCTGRPPFRAETTVAMVRQICDEVPRSIRQVNQDLPAWLEEIVERLLAKNPHDRIQTAAEAEELLAGCLAHLQEPSVNPLPSTMKWENESHDTRRQSLTRRGVPWLGMTQK